MEEEKEFFIQELDTDAIDKFKGKDSNYPNAVDPADSDFVCWSYKIFSVCVRSITSDKIVLDIKAAGVNVGRITLNRNNACVKIKENLGGDFARVDVSLCANFDKKELRIKGKICASFVCAKFNQTIIKW